MPSSAFKRALALFGLLVVVLLVACDDKTKKPDSDPSNAAAAGSVVAAAASGVKPAAGSVTLVVAYGSEKKTWLEEQAKAFAATSPRTASGKAIKVDTRAMGSGEAMQSILDGTVKAHVFSPASTLYVSLLNNRWMEKPGNTQPLAKAGEPLVLSPIVIAMWKPMAEALGWPGKRIGWSDLLAVATEPRGWAKYNHPEWGAFKFAHTHPEFSNSGYEAIVAEAYAGAKKARDLTVADIEKKETQAFIGAVEDTIVHYGKSTGFFADKMISRGPSFLSAAVLYENLVVESASKSPPMPIVAIYPTEGTFWSDHPYSVLDAPWVGKDEKDAADVFYKFLVARPAQERALALGFRPQDTKLAVGSPIDLEHGVNPKEPATLLPLPDGKTLDALLAVWRKNKKGSDIAFVFDKSGSMDGKPLQQAKAGAKSFIEALAPRDEVTLTFFDANVYPPVGPFKMETERAKAEERLDTVIAGGGTALYDAIARSYDEALVRAQKRPHQIHALVVMTDGKDEDSKLAFDVLRGKFKSEESPVKVFTIAYGQQAEGKVLVDIAEAAKGTSARGTVDDIKDVYLEMASFF